MITKIKYMMPSNVGAVRHTGSGTNHMVALHGGFSFGIDHMPEFPVGAKAMISVEIEIPETIICKAVPNGS